MHHMSRTATILADGERGALNARGRSGCGAGAGQAVLSSLAVTGLLGIASMVPR
jgi:hypothetical protein